MRGQEGGRERTRGEIKLPEQIRRLCAMAWRGGGKHQDCRHPSRRCHERAARAAEPADLGAQAAIWLGGHSPRVLEAPACRQAWPAHF